MSFLLLYFEKAFVILFPVKYLWKNSRLFVVRMLIITMYNDEIFLQIHPNNLAEQITGLFNAGFIENIFCKHEHMN